MKGYIHTLEIILSTLMILIALSQFTSLYSRDPQWAKNYLSLLSRDVIYTANAIGNDWQNSSFASSSIDKILFSDSIEYEFGLKNSAKRNIVVGCACNGAELNRLRQQLGEFPLNGGKMNFKILELAGVQDWSSLDVIVYGHYQVTDKQKLLDFLKDDKGLILISPITQAQISSDEVLRDIFGLKWVANAVTGSSSGDVFVPTHPQNRSYDIKKYFYGFRYSGTTSPRTSESDLPGIPGIQVSGKPVSCTNSTHEGTITTRGVTKKFWIIDNSEKPAGGTYCDYVFYFDEDSNNLADPDEGPYIAPATTTMNGFASEIKEMGIQVYNEMAEAETGSGWALSSANGLCTGDGDDMCSEGDGIWTSNKNKVATVNVDVTRPDRYELWIRSYRSDDPEEKTREYFISIDGGEEILIDPFTQTDPDFAGPWGWNRVETPAGFTTLLDLGTHTITFRTPKASEEPEWESSAVDWVFLRNTTFNVKNSVDFIFKYNYKLPDFSEVGPFPNDNKVDKIAVGSGKKYVMPPDDAPVASVIVNDRITDRKAGRAAWLGANNDGEDFKTLMRSLVVWASPKEFINIKNPSLGGSSTQAYTVFENGDMLNPYQIFITLWYSRRFG